MRIHRLVLLAAAAFGAGAPLLAGCEIPMYFHARHCTVLERLQSECAIGCIEGCLTWEAFLDGGPDPTLEDAGEGGSDAGAADDACDGECAFRSHAPFFGPVLLWTGPSLDPTTAFSMCPEKAPVADVWYANLLAPPVSCGACSCDPGVGSCSLPPAMTVSSKTCGGPQSGAKYSTFDAPDGWDGSCTSNDAIGPGEMCNGVPCVKSLAIDPLLVTNGKCSPVTAPPPQAPSPPSWGTTTVMCTGTPFTGTGGCKDPGKVCTPAAEPGFSQCIYQTGVFSCPPWTAPYTEPHVVYKGNIDGRTCSSCACSDGKGSSCLAKVSVFSDTACSALVGTYSIDATGPGCFDILPVGSALGSKSASVPIYQPGTCTPSGGEPTGAAFADPKTALTLCCLPST
jgi:hypothetical protein